MKNTVIKILIILILTSIILSIFAPYVHADDTGVWSKAQNWLTKGKSSYASKSRNPDAGIIDLSTVNSKVSELAGVLYAIGTLIAIIATLFLSIKFMTASSSDGKAEIKKKAIIVAVGVFVLFTSVTIWQVVVNMLSRNT